MPDSEDLVEKLELEPIVQGTVSHSLRWFHALMARQEGQ
jgi:hypothetical protein